MNEEWRQWRDGTYEVSSLGNIRRAKPGISTFVGRPVKPVISAGGYEQVQLSSDGRTTRLYVHQVVMESFYGVRPAGMVINHKDANRRNNARLNLEYITQAQNCAHALAKGLRVRGPSKPKEPKKGPQIGDLHWTKRLPDRIARAEKMPHSKLTAETVALARSRVSAGEKQVTLAKELGVSVAQMSRVIKGTRWTHA